MLGAPNEIAPSQLKQTRFAHAEPFCNCPSFFGFDELVGVQRHDPVGAKLIDCHMHKSRHMSALLIADGGLTQQHKRKAFFAQSAKHLVRAVAAAVVGYDDLVEIRNMMPNEGLNDVDLILYAANTDQ